MIDELSELLALFRTRAEPLGVVVHQGDHTSLARAFVAWAEGPRSAVVSEELRERYPAFCGALADLGVEQIAPESPAQLRDSALGVGIAHAGIAETGSALMAEPTLADRSVGMLPRAQAIVVPTRALLPSLDDAAPILRALALAPGRNMVTLVTGPSRTADIERVLTVGVQGPGRVMVLFADDLEPVGL
ncbi:MAG: LUD domain-containing protein [Thermomicrobiales bacterium]|nr:LUD domain-containing protein [Thermomicrobiales bacterium]